MKKKQSLSFKTRAWVVLVILCLGILIAWAKAGTLQILRGDTLKYLSEKQHLRSVTYNATRGNIYDRNNHLLSTSITLDSVYAEPNRINNPDKTFRSLKKELPFLSVKTLKKLRSDRAFIWVSRRIDPNAAKRLKRQDLDGIGFIKEEKRFYPHHGLLGQTLGLISIDENALSGLELAFDHLLKPKSFTTLSMNDARGKPVRVFAGPSIERLHGNDIHLTIDRNIQYAAEEALLKALKKHRAKAGWAIVIKPKTGEILALANAPLFNPNHPVLKRETYRNNAISHLGEPGSTFKMVTFAAGFEAGVIDLDKKIDCEDGVWKQKSFTVRDVIKKKWLTPLEIFKLSSNIGTFKIAKQIGKERLFETIERFGFGQKPGLGLLEESYGSVPEVKSWKAARFANISFGYGLMASSLQTLLAAATIANLGVRVSPKLVREKQSIRFKRDRVRVLSQKAAKSLTKLMVADTQTGTGKKAAIEGILVAGKTGTAEKVDPRTGRYDKNLNISSFVGFAPANDPEIAALIAIDEPKGVAYGGVVAAPVFQEIVSYALLSEGLLYGNL